MSYLWFLAVIKHLRPKATSVGKDLFHRTAYKSITEENQGRNSGQEHGARTEAEAMEEC